MQLLLKRRKPVSGVLLAQKLNISPRTLYRDIATLQAQGARIDGEAGVGYLLQPGFTLPPLMFSENEIEAISLGSKWVAENADENLSEAASDVLAKIADVIPEELRRRLHTSPLLVGPSATGDDEKKRLLAIREAIHGEQKMSLRSRCRARSR
jgi:predicted DNA-binding transcriptional regulator YafY